MKLIEAVEEVLQEDPNSRKQEYLWSFFIKVLKKMGYTAFIDLKRGIPSPESIIRSRREILNKQNKFPKDFEEEEGVTYEPKQKEV